MTMYLVLSAFTNNPISFLATDKASAFFLYSDTSANEDNSFRNQIR